MKVIAAVLVVASTVLAITIVTMYLNVTALVQRQSDEINNLREGLDDMTGIIHDLWDNAPLPDIRTNQTAQDSYFRSSD